MKLTRKALDKAIERAKDHELFCKKYHSEKCTMPGCEDNLVLLALVKQFEKPLKKLGGKPKEDNWDV